MHKHGIQPCLFLLLSDKSSILCLATFELSLQTHEVSCSFKGIFPFMFMTDLVHVMLHHAIFYAFILAKTKSSHLSLSHMMSQAIQFLASHASPKHVTLQLSMHLIFSCHLHVLNTRNTYTRQHVYNHAITRFRNQCLKSTLLIKSNLFIKVRKHDICNLK